MPAMQSRMGCEKRKAHPVPSLQISSVEREGSGMSLLAGGPMVVNDHGEEVHVRVQYECPCGAKWVVEWTCAYADRCPSCGEVTEPGATEDLAVQPKEQAA